MYQIDKSLFPTTYAKDLRGLAAWLETQNPDEIYDLNDSIRCVFGRFHCEALRVQPVTCFDLDDNCLSKIYGKEAWNIASGHPKTFGAALERVRKVL